VLGLDDIRPFNQQNTKVIFGERLKRQEIPVRLQKFPLPARECK
jgi:hypothetical protein